MRAQINVANGTIYAINCNNVLRRFVCGSNSVGWCRGTNIIRVLYSCGMGSNDAVVAVAVFGSLLGGILLLWAWSLYQRLIGSCKP